MKRLLILTLLFLGVCASANAQKWNVSKTAGDPLKGTSDAFAYRCARRSNYFYCYSDSHIIKIGCSNAIFDPHPTTYINYLDVTIGFYVGDTLVDKVKVMFSLNSGFDAAYCYRKGLNKRIITHLKTKGTVRIIAPTYSGDDYDLMLPMNPEIRYNEKKK
jgi:hypothetical protein